VKYAGGHDPGRLALPSDTEDQPDDGEPEQPETTAAVPPPVDAGPWSDDPARAARGPWGRRN